MNINFLFDIILKNNMKLGDLMNNKGVTLAELLIVIVVMGIIAAITAVSVSNIVGDSKIKVDTFNLSTLNIVTERYSYDNVPVNNDIFNRFSTNDERISELKVKGYIEGSVKPQQSGAYFDWDVDNQQWVLVGGEVISSIVIDSIDYDFSEKTGDDFSDLNTKSINHDKWELDENGDLVNQSGQTNLFIPISKNEYTMEVDASLSEGTSGGYGIFFDTILRKDNPKKDDGLILQFDRGYGSGAIIVRPRSNGNESSPIFVLKESQSDLIPSKYADPSWWTSEHTIKIDVTNISVDERNAKFYIDGNFIGEMTYDNKIAGETVYTGFRGWSTSPTTYESFKID